MFLNDQIISKIKELIKFPFDSRYIQNGWTGSKNAFIGHVLLNWNNFFSFTDSHRVYREFVSSDAYAKNEVIVSGGEYYKALIDLDSATIKTLNNTEQFIKTSKAFELAETLMLNAIEEVFSRWEECLILETEQSTQVEILSRYVGNEDSTPIAGRNEIKVCISKNHTSPNIKLVINQLGVYSRKVITDLDIIITDGETTKTVTTDLVANRVNLITLDIPFESFNDVVEIKTTNDNFLIYDNIPLDFEHFFIHSDTGSGKTYTIAPFLPHLQIEADYTRVIINNLTKFVRAIQMQFAVTSLEYFAYNPNSEINRNEANINKEDLIYELDKSRESGGFSLRAKANKAFKSISSDFFPKDGIVIGCNQRTSGVTYTTF